MMVLDSFPPSPHTFSTLHEARAGLGPRFPVFLWRKSSFFPPFSHTSPLPPPFSLLVTFLELLAEAKPSAEDPREREREE